MNFNGAVALSLKAFGGNDYNNFQNKSYQTFHPVSDTQGHEWGATVTPAPFFFSFFMLFISHLWFFFLIPLLLMPAPSNLFFHLHQVERAQWDLSWHIFNGRYSGNVPHTFTSDDKPCYLHAALPLRCSPLGSPRKRFRLFKCQFGFSAHYRECASISVRRERCLVRSQCNLGWQIKF